MAAPTEGTSIPSDGTTDETIAREDEEDEEGKEEGKESRASGEKKGSYRGGTGGGGSATGGQQHGDTVSVLQPGTWTWTWTWTLWNLRARRGTGREARHGRHSSGKMHKAVVSWLLYMTVLQQRPLPRNRGRLAGPRGRGSSRLTRARSEADGGLEGEGPWCSRASRRRWWWPRGS